MLHQHRRQLGEVGGAAGAGDVLELGAAEDGVDGVAHFVEEGLDFSEGEEGGLAVGVCGRGEVADEGYGWELVDSAGGGDGGGHAVVGGLEGG